VRRLVVIALERACSILDRSPWPLYYLGCPRGLALWSSELDERWHTGVWQPYDQGPVTR
jgi:hypothetical protein